MYPLEVAKRFGGNVKNAVTNINLLLVIGLKDMAVSVLGNGHKKEIKNNFGTVAGAQINERGVSRALELCHKKQLINYVTPCGKGVRR